MESFSFERVWYTLESSFSAQPSDRCLISSVYTVLRLWLSLHTTLSCSLAPSCRSLNMDCENQEKDKDGNPTTTGAFSNSNTNNSECFMSGWNKQATCILGFTTNPTFIAGIQTIDSTQALFLPIGASVSLLVMFFFFDSVQVVFTICTAGNCSSTATGLLY